MDQEEKKEYLKSYGRMKLEEKSIQESIEELRARKLSPGSPRNDGMPKGNQRSDLSDYAAKLDELERSQNAKQWEIVHSYQVIEADIRDVPDEIERALLRYRYLCCFTWEDICEKMGYSYRQVHNIHAKALEHFQKSAWNCTP